jgi:tRNA threonylcarbamoyladenosine modification (KEOPS) complex  Pcc1 subunit
MAKAYRAEITLHKENGAEYRKILALSEGGGRTRSSTKATESSGTLTITITASDIVALRASINSIMRDLQVIAAVGRAGRRSASLYSAKTQVRRRR